MITVSIVIYKTKREELTNVINCILNSNVSKVYLVDNSPTDNLRDIGELSDKFEYIFGHGNIGYGAANNIAIRKAMKIGANYHIVVNPDILYEEGVVEKLTKYMDENPDVGQVMPKIIYPDGQLQYVCKLIPTPYDLIFKRFFPSFLVKESLNRFQLKFTHYDREMNVPYLSGCFMFFRMSALQKCGLFDENFFMYPEDIDITRRIHRSYRTMFYPEVVVIHAHAAESKTNLNMLQIHIVNMIKYFNKWGWFCDKERRAVNRQLLNELGYKKIK